MSPHRTVIFCLGIGAAVVLAIACDDGPQPNDLACTSPGGTCVTDINQCGETLPFPCAQGTCCVLNDAGVSHAAPTATGTASSPEAGASGD